MPHNVYDILEGRYKNVITNELSSTVINAIINGDNLEEIISNNISGNDLSWLCVGISSLLYFVQANWTGPHINEDIDWLITKRAEALNNLSLHDECNINVQKPELLYLSKKIFSNMDLQSRYESCIWWLFRSNLLHQYILDESSGAIFEKTEKLIKQINNLNILKEPLCKLLSHLEIARFYLYYRRIQISEKYIADAQSITGLTLNLEGAMGKRTKYQQEEKAQLYLKVTIDKDIFPSICCEDVPTSVNLNDELRLERIEFSEHKEESQLGAMEEAVILTK